MMGKFQIRTDLALEAKESCEAKDGQPRGVRVTEQEDPEREIYTTTVVIETENGARAEPYDKYGFPLIILRPHQRTDMTGKRL